MLNCAATEASSARHSPIGSGQLLAEVDFFLGRLEGIEKKHHLPVDEFGHVGLQRAGATVVIGYQPRHRRLQKTVLVGAEKAGRIAGCGAQLRVDAWARHFGQVVGGAAGHRNGPGATGGRQRRWHQRNGPP